MVQTKVLAAGAIGAGVGALQTPILREFVDKAYPTTNIPSLGGFGYLSSLIGIIGGGAGLGIGAIGMSKDGAGRQRFSDEVVTAGIDYGVTALIGGVFSGIYSAVTEAECVAKGGYFYDGVCHSTPPPGGLSMQPQVQQAVKAYTPPATVSGVDMNLLKQMSAKLQELAQENQALKVQMQQIQAKATTLTQPQVQEIIPGPVKQKQERYGFMEGIETAQPLVTKRTEQIKKRFDFMG